MQNGAVGGTTGQSLGMQAIKIRLTNLPNFSVLYRVHMADIGWGLWEPNGAQAGTTGESRDIQAIEIKIIPPSPPKGRGP